MRTWAWLLATCVVTSGTARADEVDDLVTRGEALAKQSEFTQAIDAFKAADLRRPRAKHLCLIGLVYTRRELWPQAELFLSLCRTRSTVDDPLPDWIASAEELLAAKLANAKVAAVTITVAPPEAAASIAVSSFAPDETFAPRTIHLATGKHMLEVSAPGYVTATREVVVTGGVPITVAIELQPPRSREPTPAPVVPIAVAPVLVPPPPRDDVHASRMPAYLMYGSAVFTVAGVASHLLWFKPARDRLAAEPTLDAYRADTGAFDTSRAVTIGLYAAAAITLATGLVLHDHRSAAHVAVVPRSGGGSLVVEWAR